MAFNDNFENSSRDSRNYNTYNSYDSPEKVYNSCNSHFLSEWAPFHNPVLVFLCPLFSLFSCVNFQWIYMLFFPNVSVVDIYKLYTSLKL